VVHYYTIKGIKRCQDYFLDRLEVQAPRDCLHLILISKGRAPMDAVANGLEFGGGQRPVDPLGLTR
jgi:hypothetical protein